VLTGLINDRDNLPHAELGKVYLSESINGLINKINCLTSRWVKAISGIH